VPYDTRVEGNNIIVSLGGANKRLGEHWNCGLCCAEPRGQASAAQRPFAASTSAAAVTVPAVSWFA